MAISKTIRAIVSVSLLGFCSSTLLAGDIGVEGNVTATNFIGNGAGLTGVVKTEVDPVVDILTADKWCKADSSGAVIQCNQNAPPSITVQFWVPRTGYWQCWDEDGNWRECSNTGEDGEYKMGGRIVDPVDANDWHPSFRATPRFNDSRDGAVTDNLTGLIWLKNANCIADNIGFDNDGTVNDGRVTWQHSLDFVRGMNTGLYNCGDTSNSGGAQTDWRLPNSNELHSLPTPSVSPDHPFSDVQPGWYWSSSTGITRTSAWIAYSMGGGYSAAIKTNNYYVWPVRGGQ